MHYYNNYYLSNDENFLSNAFSFNNPNNSNKYHNKNINDDIDYDDT